MTKKLIKNYYYYRANNSLLSYKQVLKLDDAIQVILFDYTSEIGWHASQLGGYRIPTTRHAIKYSHLHAQKNLVEAIYAIAEYEDVPKLSELAQLELNTIINDIEKHNMFLILTTLSTDNNKYRIATSSEVDFKFFTKLRLQHRLPKALKCTNERLGIRIALNQFEDRNMMGAIARYLQNKYYSK